MSLSYGTTKSFYSETDSIPKMNILGFLSILKSKKFEKYNGDRCVYIEGNSVSALEKQCSDCLGYLPKYADTVQQQLNGKEEFIEF